MTLPPLLLSDTLPIAAVERDTGLSKDTLRVWERRYGFPQPLRDGNGDRVYPVAQVDKLRLLKRLLDQGHRPGRIAASSVEQLEALAQAPVAGPSGMTPAQLHPGSDALRPYLHLVETHRVEELRRELTGLAVRVGVAHFVTEVVAPLTRLVGQAWADGKLAIYEEHLYTESVQAVLRQVIGSMAHPGESPRVMLTTVPQEPHGLGLLMAQAMFALEGARCIGLGVQTPVMEIVRGAEREQIDIVALSFSPIVNAYQLQQSLKQLRGELAPTTELWAGGTSPALRRRAPAGVRVLRTLAEVAPAVSQWRAQRSSA